MRKVLTRKPSRPAAICSIFLLSFGLVGCEKLPPILQVDLAELICPIPFVCKDKNRVILDVATFNYTDYDVSQDAVQSPEKNDIRSGVSGAVVWNKKQKPPATIKVWWEVTYDKEASRKDRTYNRRTEKRSAAGTVWCEAIVKIKEPYPANPRHLDLHFFPDGHVEAKVVESSDPIVSEEERKKLPRLPAGRYCGKTIDNPWYGVDTTNPWA